MESQFECWPRRERWPIVPRRKHCWTAFAVGHLLADRGYDTNRVLAAAREYDAESCQALHLVRNGFGKLKERRGDALCAECGFVPGAVGQNNLVTRPKKKRYLRLRRRRGLPGRRGWEHKSVDGLGRIRH